MQKLVLFLKMIFVYPVVFFTSLHAIKSDYSLKFMLFKLWSKFLVKQASAKVTLKHSDLIPLETGYVFVVNHANPLDPCILIEHLPVESHFVFDVTERVPYLNRWLKRLNTLRIDYSQSNFKSIKQEFLSQMDQSSIILFFNTLKGIELGELFYQFAKDEHLTLIPVRLENTQYLFKKGHHHHVTVDIQIPLYFEEYAEMTHDSIHRELKQRLEGKPIHE